MNRFGDGYQSDKGEEDFDQNELENNFSQTVSKSFISSVPPTIQNVSSQNEKSAVYSTIYQKDPKRVLNHLLDIPVWRQVLQKTEEFSKINGNSESIQKVMNSLIKWQTQTGCFLAQNFQRHYTANKFDENLQKRLAKDVQALILKYIRGKGTEDYLKQECEEFSTTLNFNSLFLGESCSCIKTNTKYLKKINDEISENQIYKILYRYGKNIYYLEYQFIKYYFTQFFNKLSYKVFYDILQQLIKDPFYSLTNRKDLNYEQNTVLIEKIWLNDKNPLFKLIEAQKYSHTTQRLIDLDKRKIEDFLLHNAKFPLSRQELDDIRIVLDSGDLQSFFDKTRYIKDELKKVYPYIAKNCEHYLNLNKEQVCLVQLQQQNLLRLRSKLFQMLKKEQFNISDWSLIENSAMSNTLNKAQRAFKKDLASYFSLKKWALQNLSDYFSKAFEPKRQKDLVKHELKLCLINSKVILKYEQVETIVKELLDTPYTEVIQASGLLKPNDINLLKEQLQKLELFRQYSAKFKEDPQYIRKKAESEIYKVLDSVDLKLTSDKKEELYQRFLKNPRASAIYETPNICYLYKQTIFKKLSEIEEIRDYIQNFKKVQRTQKLSMVKSQLQKIITNRTDYELVLDYISINGEIIFQNDQDCSVKLQQTYSDLKKVMTKIKPQNRKNLRQLQQKPFFIELKQQLPELYNIYLNQCKAKFKYTVKNIISKNFQLGEDEKIQLQDIIIDIIDSQDIKALDENQRLKDSNFNSVVSQIKGSKMFKLLSNSTNAIKANQSKYVQITLKNKIRSIYDHQNLVEFSPEQKGAIINSLIQRMDFEQIKTFNFLNAIQQQFIITFITQSDEYKQFCNKGKKSNNTINGAAQPSIQKSEKVVEKKKIQPPRAAEKKEEQSPSERSIPINPQRVESINISKKQVQLTQQFQDVIPDKPSQEINPPLTKQQLETRKKQIIRKWTEIMANINDKNLFTKERLAQSNQTQFVEKLMMAHPWTLQNTTFFQASRDVLRKKIIVELQAIIKQKGEFLEDIKTLQSV